MLPNKKSFKWLYVFILVFIVNLIAMSAVQKLSNNALEIYIVFRFVLVTLIIGAIACLGYFGLRAFSYIFLISNVIGLGYMFFIAFSGRNGWKDLSSIIGFLCILLIGVVIGMITQITLWLLKVIRLKNNIKQDIR